MKMTFGKAAIVASALASTALFLSVSTSPAEARARLYISPHYALHAVYFVSPDLPWYAVRTYYNGGPWSGAGYSWAGWDDYAAKNGIGCTPGSIIKGGDGIYYYCQ